MSEIQEKIASGLERHFAERGFAEPSVPELRDAAGVSLRTLYKYTPSRSEMVYAALEHRHRRYLEELFADLPTEQQKVPAALIDRVAGWMRTQASHGCLFHAAVAAAPEDARLMALLKDHKAQVAERAAAVAGIPGREIELTLILEGLTQTFPLYGEATVIRAKQLAATL
ncbi:TetR family transcriptional regulator [Rhodobacterales bacterium]|nr:TetR family transcriptional regulator [Rhodobacterales bacterium]